jgi:hypothetical protein
MGNADIPTNGFFEKEIDNTASFVITEQEWQSMAPREIPSGGRALRRFMHK